MSDFLKKPATKPGQTGNAVASNGSVDGAPVHTFNDGSPGRSAVVPAPERSAPDPARRHFLKAAPLGALAVVAGTPPPAAAAPLPAAAAPLQSGYHETEHIRRYYQTAAYW